MFADSDVKVAAATEDLEDLVLNPALHLACIDFGVNAGGRVEWIFRYSYKKSMFWRFVWKYWCFSEDVGVIECFFQN